MHDGQLFLLLKEKSLAACTVLIDEYKPLVEKIVFQYGIEPEKIADVVQESFLNIYRKISRLESGNLLDLIYQQTFQTLRGYQKRITNQNEVLETINKRYGYYIENKHQMLLHTLIRGLDSKYKHPLILYYFYDKSIEEISTILNASIGTVELRLKRGEELLKDKYEKIINDQKENIGGQLRELNYIYDRLPEFIKTQEILLAIEKLNLSHKWKKALPTIVGIIGLLFFSVFIITYIQEEKDRQAFIEQQEAQEQNKGKQVEGTNQQKKQELPPEVVAYLEEAKEKLVNELGMVDISRISSIQTMEMYLKEVLQNNVGNEAFTSEHVKDYIDAILTPPSLVKEDLLNPDKRDEKFMTYLYSLSNYESNFQEYLDSLLVELQIQTDEYGNIILFQDDIANYSGPEEIRELMKTLNSQGYYLTRISDHDKITVAIDFVQIKDNVANAGFNDGYLRYLDFTIEYGNQFHSNDWEEYDDILLELEYILENYGFLYTETFKDYIISDLYSNLHHLLWGNPGPRPLSKEDRQFFYQFLQNNKDSVFWDVINTTVKEYEENEWLETINPPDFTYIKILFDKRFGDIKLENFEHGTRWPIKTNSIVIYKELKESFDQSKLVELSPIEMVSLYDYAEGKDDNEVFEQLMTINGAREKTDIKFDLSGIRHSREYVFTEYPDENNAIVHFANWGLENVTSIKLIRDNNIWKIAWIFKNSQSN